MREATMLRLPTKRQDWAMSQASRTAMRGSSPFLLPQAKILRKGNKLSRARACSTRALPTRLASAEEMVEENKPMTTKILLKHTSCMMFKLVRSCSRSTLAPMTSTRKE